MNHRQEAEQDLHATAESIQEDAQALVELEDRKRRLPATDPRVDHLSDQAVRLATEVLAKTRIQRQLSRELDAPG